MELKYGSRRWANDCWLLLWRLAAACDVRGRRLRLQADNFLASVRCMLDRVQAPSAACDTGLGWVGAKLWRGEGWL